jgi:hypothetical protein
MLFHSSLLPGRSFEWIVSLLPVSSQTVLSSVKPCAIATVGSAPPASVVVGSQGTVTSTDRGRPSKLGTVPRQSR